MTYKFTKKAEKAVQIAESLAIELGHNYVGTEHILYGLVKEPAGIANKVLESQNITRKVKILQENLPVLERNCALTYGKKLNTV